jgi:putative DNA primase/helicase
MQNTSTAQITSLVPKQSPTGQQKLTCAYGGGRFEVSGKGVYFHGKDKEGNEQPPQWICAPLHITAKTRDEKSVEWGRMLEWHDDDIKAHQWAMPLELLESDGAEVRKELARQGLHIASTQAARNLLPAYIKAWPVEARACCVDRLGWHGDVFVTPTGSIGHTNELVVFQNSHAIEPAFSISGNEYEWRDTVAALAQGNTRLVFAISVAFAGTLAEIAGEDSGGFHFRGASSSGKSTTLKLAASVWGNPSKYVRLWRGTTNGFEGLATLHNDGLLILDEISQIDPMAAGDVPYLLANGQGKARANRNGQARASQRWRLLYLSAGEESLLTVMNRAGKKPSAGQEIRLADIEADGGAGMGIFETLHNHPSGAALSTAIKDAATKYHGAIGKKWLSYLVVNRKELADSVISNIKTFMDEVVPKGSGGQIERVARRFALASVAGELATQYKLTGWQKGEATQATRACFASWLENFGSVGNREERTILAQVRAFFEAHGASRFEYFLATSEQRVPNRAGFYRDGEDGEREFLVLSESFRREVCQGFDEKMVKRVLIDAGLLLPGKDGKPTQVIRFTGLGTSRVYVIRYKGEND